jgi:YggT family protein
MGILITFVNLLYWAFWLLILARVIISFTRMDPYNPIRRTVYELTEPILAPIRRILPPSSGLDFSPLIALLLLELLRMVLFRLIL